MASARNMYNANEAMNLLLQSKVDDKEFTESEAETDSESEDEKENMDDVLIGDGGVHFDVIVNYQQQQQDVECGDNSQQFVVDLDQEEEENTDNFTDVNIEIPQKKRK